MSWVTTLTIETAVVLVAAPIAGVLEVSRVRARSAYGLVEPPLHSSQQRWKISVRLIGGIIAAATISALGLWLYRVPVVSPWSIVWAHVMLALVAAASAASGALIASLDFETLDAAAITVGGWIGAAVGLLALGPALIGLPTRLLNALLIANPLVVVTTAADVDIFRSPALYRISPVAHIRFDYPAWPVAALTYTLIALTCSILAAIRAGDFSGPRTREWMDT
jgi:hypothetical protein